MCLLSGYCRRSHREHPEIERFVDHLWSFIDLPGTSEAFGAWFDSTPSLIGVTQGVDYAPEVLAALADLGVDEKLFRLMLTWTFEIVDGNFFARTDEPFTRRCLDEVSAIVAEAGVCWPDLARFACSMWSDGDGWGQTPSPIQMTGWRELARSYPWWTPSSLGGKAPGRVEQNSDGPD